MVMSTVLGIYCGGGSPVFAARRVFSFCAWVFVSFGRYLGFNDTIRRQALKGGAVA